MSFDEVSQENLAVMLHELAEHLNVANRGLFDAEDYDLNKYEDLKLLHQVIMNKSKLSTMESQAFVDELATIRKK